SPPRNDINVVIKRDKFADLNVAVVVQVGGVFVCSRSVNEKRIQKTNDDKYEKLALASTRHNTTCKDSFHAFMQHIGHKHNLIHCSAKWQYPSSRQRKMPNRRDSVPDQALIKSKTGFTAGRASRRAAARCNRVRRRRAARPRA